MTKIKTLVFGGGEIHDWQGVQPLVVNALSAADALEITTAQEDLSILEADNLSPYDVLVFHYTVGTISDAQRDGLSQWLAAGKGYVGIHRAPSGQLHEPGRLRRDHTGGWPQRPGHRLLSGGSGARRFTARTTHCGRWCVSDRRIVPRVSILRLFLYMPPAAGQGHRGPRIAPPWI